MWMQWCSVTIKNCLTEFKDWNYNVPHKTNSIGKQIFLNHIHKLCSLNVTFYMLQILQLVHLHPFEVHFSFRVLSEGVLLLNAPLNSRSEKHFLPSETLLIHLIASLMWKSEREALTEAVRQSLLQKHCFKHETPSAGWFLRYISIHLSKSVVIMAPEEALTRPLISFT